MILSLFDYTGIWSQPYRDAGYQVEQIDIQHGKDVYHYLDRKAWTGKVRGIILQPPCTDFANSGARWFYDKDTDGRTQESVDLVNFSMRYIAAYKPVWWVLENPTGRIHKLCPILGNPVFKFSPHEFGENYRKTTWLWGNFVKPVKTTPDAKPIGARPGQPDEWYSRVGGKSIETKNYRSATSIKFAEAFYKVNP